MTESLSSSIARIAAAGWRIAVAVLPLGVALWLVTAWVPDAEEFSEPTTLVRRIGFGVAISALTLAVVALLVRFADRRSLRYAGLDPRTGWRYTLGGATLWAGPALVTFGVLALLGLPLTLTVPVSELVVTVLLLFLAVLLTEAIPEELIFRGYVMSALARVTRGWWIIVIQAVLFCLFAGVLRQNWNPIDLSLFLAMGIVFGYLRRLTGAVWMPIGFHATFQTGAQLLLTHDVLDFAGGSAVILLAVGVIPFTAAAMLVTSARVRRAITSRKTRN